MSIVATSLESALAGDQHAFMELLEPELSGAYRLAVGMLRHRSEAEDAVQEAVLKAWRNFGGFRRDAALRPWLFAIVANECRSRRRSRWWSVITGAAGSREDAEPDTRLDAATADVRRALRRLPHDLRVAVVLRYYLDLSFDEVAATLRISPKAAQSRVYRALERLRLTPEVMSHE